MGVGMLKGKWRLAALLLALLVVVSGCASKSEPDREEIRKPGKVRSAQELASRAIPGWARAKEQGLVVPLGVTQQVPNRGANITLEEAWFSAREYHLLYTIKSDDGQYLMPTRVQLWTDGSQGETRYGSSHIEELRTWGGFSAEGFHGVFSFPRFEGEVPGERIWLMMMGWEVFTLGEPVHYRGVSGIDLKLPIPWKATYLDAPAAEVITLSQSKRWLNRTLTLDRLEVATGEIRLIGQVELAKGEIDPYPEIQLQVGGQVRRPVAMEVEAAEEVGRYRFTAVFDGPDRWPATVKLQIGGIAFTAEGTLEWPINWAKYRTQTDGKPMAIGDRRTVQFYDSDLASLMVMERGISIEVKNPTGEPPYVRTNIWRGRGREALFEVHNASGDRLTDIGGSGGSDSLSVLWGDGLPEPLRQSDRLTLRYVNPGAMLVLDESWVLASK